MTSIHQREHLQSQIWKIANEVRGAVDGWDFKQFVLGTLFYRFISENFADYIKGGDDSIDYASLKDSVITPEIKDDAIKTKGYFIYPKPAVCQCGQKCQCQSESEYGLESHL
nr:type I restriction-modification system subunit M N-terminal domain-containing protein [Fibrobacter sp. UWS1]